MWGAKHTTTDPLNYYRTCMLDNAWMAGITNNGSCICHLGHS